MGILANTFNKIRSFSPFKKAKRPVSAQKVQQNIRNLSKSAKDDLHKKLQTVESKHTIPEESVGKILTDFSRRSEEIQEKYNTGDLSSKEYKNALAEIKKLKSEFLKKPKGQSWRQHVIGLNFKATESEAKGDSQKIRNYYSRTIADLMAEQKKGNISQKDLNQFKAQFNELAGRGLDFSSTKKIAENFKADIIKTDSKAELDAYFAPKKASVFDKFKKKPDPSEAKSDQKFFDEVKYTVSHQQRRKIISDIQQAINSNPSLKRSLKTGDSALFKHAPELKEMTIKLNDVARSLMQGKYNPSLSHVNKIESLLTKYQKKACLAFEKAGFPEENLPIASKRAYVNPQTGKVNLNSWAKHEAQTIVSRNPQLKLNPRQLKKQIIETHNNMNKARIENKSNNVISLDAVRAQARQNIRAALRNNNQTAA